MNEMAKTGHECISIFGMYCRPQWKGGGIPGTPPLTCTRVIPGLELYMYVANELLYGYDSVNNNNACTLECERLGKLLQVNVINN